MIEVYLVAYLHYGEQKYFNTFDRQRAIDYAAQHRGTIFRAKEWLALGDNSSLSQHLCTTEKAPSFQLAATAT